MMFDKMRTAMVDSQLRTTGVNDPSVLAAIRAVPRERFVPAARAAQAYADAAVELVPGRWLIEPMVFGLLVTNAHVEPGDRVLVVGAGSGYSAAVIGQLTPHVTALEQDPALAALARANGIAVVEGPLVDGWPAAAPYDVLFCDGAVAELPPALLAQASDGARLAAVVVGPDGVGRATVGRVFGGRFTGTGFIETGAAMLPGFGRAAGFVF
ncbi:MAG: protein-L-isoaspartate O-methyltransferase family protein [Janthinobacterium lividum]